MITEQCTFGLFYHELTEIRKMLWGTNIKEDVFDRWSQGFEFSSSEPSALVQYQGGPCALIAPVQAFLLKILIMETPAHSFNDLTDEKCRALLIEALCGILLKCSSNSYKLVILKNISNKNESKSDLFSTTSSSDSHDQSRCAENSARNVDQPDNPEINNLATDKWTPDEFHLHISVLLFENIDDVKSYYSRNYDILQRKYGVVLFMYTVIMTKSIEHIYTELLDTTEPLIDSIYGYGSQSLINLMLTGMAVGHVWDHDKNVGGLTLRGLSEQSDIGFITLMEQMRYCTVGSFYKNPKNPVWIMGSETHLTVLFSHEKRLVSLETRGDEARRVFKLYDPDGNNFIPSSVLQNVLYELDLVSDSEYVEIMQKKLDAENLGIILLNCFMDEFFPEEKHYIPDTFDLMHYNGIPGSNYDNKVAYNKGTAILLESDLKCMCDPSNPMQTCLQTKWANIEVNWDNARTPSLN